MGIYSVEPDGDWYRLDCRGTRNDSRAAMRLNGHWMGGVGVGGTVAQCDADCAGCKDSTCHGPHKGEN